MKKYYTLIQPFLIGKDQDTSLTDFLYDRNIPFHIGGVFGDEQLYSEYYPADWTSTASYFKYAGNSSITFAVEDNLNLLRKFVILLDEHELSAIKLSVDNVTIIRNTRYYEFVNKVRSIFKWFID